MRDLEPVIQAFEAYLDGLPPDSAIAERAHAKGVAACAVRLAALRDEDPALALIAGMLHDLRRVAGGDTSRKHGRTGAALVAPLLDSWDGLSKEDRRLVRRAIRRHGRKRRIDDAFSELIKDADIWQSSHQGESYESGSPKAVRLLVAERQHALGTIDPMAGWPPPSTPPRVARRLFEACQAFAASLAPVILHEKNHPAPSRHAIHALRQQARALHL